MARLALIIAALLAAIGSYAQTDSVRVSFVVFFPGPEIYELEGHAALRIQHGPEDVAVSYGTFDFEAPNFVYRFVKGETDYWVAVYPWEPFEASYARQGRKIVEHEIMMDSVQKQRLIDLVAENMRPENRTYRYNYVKDNCSTRPLGILEKALGEEIELPMPQDFTAEGRTFRDVMRLCHKSYPWYQFGIDLALGSGIDYPISERERAFAPISLASQLDGALVGGRPLAKPAVERGGGRDATLAPTPWLLSPMAVALALLCVCIGFTARDVRRLRVTRWLDALLFGVYGLAGCVIAFLVFVSSHEATSPNWLLLWLNPLCLIVPIFIWLKKCNIVVFSYQIANFVLLIVLAIPWPFAGQSGNAAFVPLVACDMARALSYIYVTIHTRKRIS